MKKKRKKNLMKKKKELSKSLMNGEILKKK